MRGCHLVCGSLLVNWRPFSIERTDDGRKIVLLRLQIRLATVGETLALGVLTNGLVARDVVRLGAQWPWYVHFKRKDVP